MTLSPSLSWRPLVSALGLLALLGLGCGSPSIQVRDDGTTFDLQGTKNESLRAGENITIPESFPSDLPRYPEATTKIALKEGETYTISQETPDDIDTVVRNLDQQLTQNGYTLTIRLGNVGEPIQLLDYGHPQKQTTLRAQVSRDTNTQKTMILIARVPKAQ